MPAPVITRDEIIIVARDEAVCSLHTAINCWSGWKKDISHSNLDEPLAVGATFHWKTAGMKIASTIGEALPFRNLILSITSVVIPTTLLAQGLSLTVYSPLAKTRVFPNGCNWYQSAREWGNSRLNI